MTKRRRRRPISERDYLVATDLAKARIAREVVASLSACVRYDMGGDEALKFLDRTIARLERLVQGDA